MRDEHQSVVSRLMLQALAPRNPPGNPTAQAQAPQLDHQQQKLRDQLQSFRTTILRAAKRLDLPLTGPLIQNFMYK